MPDTNLADKLVVDFLDQKISSLGATTRLGAIKGIDRGTITRAAVASEDATVGAVVEARSILHHIGERPAQSSAMNGLSLVNTTTIRATGNFNFVSTSNYQLVEYNA